MRDHQRQLGQLERLQKRRATESHVPSWRRNPLTRMIDHLRHSASSSSSSLVASSSTLPPPTEDQDVLREFDHDMAEAIVSVGGRFVGLRTEDLMQSPGLRKLIARNMRWFQNTPDWLKMIVLLLAKRVNGEVRRRHHLVGLESVAMMAIPVHRGVAAMETDIITEEAKKEKQAIINPAVQVPMECEREEDGYYRRSEEEQTETESSNTRTTERMTTIENPHPHHPPSPPAVTRRSRRRTVETTTTEETPIQPKTKKPRIAKPKPAAATLPPKPQTNNTDTRERVRRTLRDRVPPMPQCPVEEVVGVLTREYIDVDAIVPPPMDGGEGEGSVVPSSTSSLSSSSSASSVLFSTAQS